MKNLRLMILTVVLLAAMSFSASAQTKIASVDLKKVFDGYWKTKQASATVANRATELRKELKDMADGLDKAQKDYTQLLDQANDTAISPEERDKRKQAVADKEKEILTSKANLEQFQRQADAQLGDQEQRMKSNLLIDIQKAVTDKAKAGGYMMVVNSGAMDTVLYMSSENDITDSVLAQLNAGAPVDLSKPANSTAFNISTNVP
jgi:outer membrane protein